MSVTKKFLTAVLPKALLLWGKKCYYPRVVRRFWEPEVEAIKAFVRPGDLVIDLGANAGWYAVALAGLVGSEGQVYAIEPVPETFEILSTVVQTLGLKNVEVFNCAVSDKNGSGVMELPKFEYGGTNFYMAHLVARGTASSTKDQCEVALRSLDSLMRGKSLPKVTFVKCDVEGHELAVLKGAVEFFRVAKPAMMIEVSGTAAIQDSPDNEFFSIMKGYGYAPYWYDGRKLRKRAKGHWSVNYFFLQEFHVRKAGALIED
jgi:FkbM family methyltransferase